MSQHLALSKMYPVRNNVEGPRSRAGMKPEAGGFLTGVCTRIASIELFLRCRWVLSCAAATILARRLSACVLSAASSVFHRAPSPVVGIPAQASHAR